MTTAADFLKNRRRGGRVVSNTLEFRRIYTLPRRAPDPNSEAVPGVSHADFWTSVLRLPNGERRLNPAQGWALSEAYLCRGLLADYPVGCGKTDCSLLLPSVIECERPLVVVPAAALEKKTLKVDLPLARRNWYLHPNMKFMSYETLARKNQEDYLHRFMFDLIVLDEVHRIADKDTSCFRRIRRYKDEFPDVVVAGMSGTSTSRSLRQYAHILELCLGEASPLPNRWMDLETWADCLDEGIEDEYRPEPGALLTFCAEGEGARQGFQRRLRETPGYVSVLTVSARCSLVVDEVPLEVPGVIQDAMRGLRLNRTTPAIPATGTQPERPGDFIASALEFAEHIEALTNGLFYIWLWPNDQPDFLWLDARRNWKKFANWVISRSPGGRVFDTEEQVAMAADAGELPPPDPDLGVPTDVRQKWLEHRERLTGVLREAYAGKKWAPDEFVYWDSKREPPRKAVWVSDYMVEYIERWIEKTDKGLVWVGMRALQDKLRQRGVLVYGGGEDGIVTETRSCALSIHAHSESKNLQEAYCRALFVSVPASGKTWEQAIGRICRQGQPEDEVEISVLLPTVEAWEAFNQARRDAVYVHQTKGQQQMLQVAAVTVSSEDEVARRGAVWPRSPLWTKDWSKLQPKETLDGIVEAAVQG